MNAKLLRKLADRCEREEPSRELDAAICLAVPEVRTYADEHWLEAWLALPPTRRAHVEYFPPLTSSIDAAVTLEPADAIEVCVRKYQASDIYVRITPASGPPIDCRRRTDSITEPMARCAAALRARAAIAEQTEASTQPGEANP